MPKPRRRSAARARQRTGVHASQRPVARQPAPGARGAAERLSSPVLVWLSRKPVWLLPVVTVALLVGGLAAPPVVGAPVLMLLAALVGWLSYLSWPVVQGPQRVLRVATAGLLVAAAVGRLGG